MKELTGVDIVTLTRKIREADKLVIMMDNEFIESMKDPHDVEHIALNLQIQEAAKGEKDVYLLCIRPIERDNFGLVMDMLEGGKIKCIIFVDPKDEEDREMASRILYYAMGPATLLGTSEDAWEFLDDVEPEDHRGGE